ncbi:MAG: hypothetical protein VX730_05615 [Pseudomonadota bacterium]|nr:hypothetical protein [Pseudomonadota bacterium]
MKRILLALPAALAFTLPLQAQESTHGMFSCQDAFYLIDQVMQESPAPTKARVLCALDENHTATAVGTRQDKQTEDGKNYTIELHLLQ